jgi:hypothetical protein
MNFLFTHAYYLIIHPQFNHTNNTADANESKNFPSCFSVRIATYTEFNLSPSQYLGDRHRRPDRFNSAKSETT